MAITVTGKNYEEEVINSKERVLLDFHATWCGPCKMLSPVLQEIEKDENDFKICKIDIDQSPELAEQFQIMSVPTLVVMEAGKVVKKSSGVRPKEEILSMMSL